jgi:hypothetical protein
LPGEVAKYNYMKHILIAITILSLFSCKNDSVSQKKTVIASAAKEPRKLRYIMKPNHCGILGFFSDGTVAGSIDPKISRHNIATLDTAEVYTDYKVQDHYIVFDDDHSTLDFSTDFKDAYRWVMVDYQWKMQIPE